jgi:hypothetical protein
MSKTENLLAKLGKMTEADCLAKLTEYKVTPFKTKEETEYFAKYLVQGEVTQKLEGLANVVYARSGVDELFRIQPHLASKYSDQSQIVTGSPVAKTVKAKTPKVSKAPQVKVAKTVYPDGTVVFREDRQKFMAWFNGKAEAARPTQEAALAYLAKKYGITGTVLK